jgi:predicted Zn-dependent protease with MMP-like domain
LEYDAFADLVAEALDSLPDEFLQRLENVQVTVEEWPSRDDLLDAGLSPRDKYHLLGLYHGVPLTSRHTQYVALPDEITIFQRPIEALVGEDDEAIREQVRHTVVHEIAHFYGIDDDRLEELGKY